jgi:hypothetical protein
MLTVGHGGTQHPAGGVATVTLVVEKATQPQPSSTVTVVV